MRIFLIQNAKNKGFDGVAHTKENIDILEKVFIALYRAEGKAEYNIANGGQGGEKPCGTCGTCIDRKEAFVKNGIMDIN